MIEFKVEDRQEKGFVEDFTIPKLQRKILQKFCLTLKFRVKTRKNFVFLLFVKTFLCLIRSKIKRDFVHHLSWLKETFIYNIKQGSKQSYQITNKASPTYPLEFHSIEVSFFNFTGFVLSCKTRNVI